MFDSSRIFSSRAKYLVLRALSFQTAPIPLRHVSYLAGLPVFSVQCALKELLKDRIVTRAKKGRLVLFSLNRAHACHEFVKRVFELEEDMLLKQHMAQHDERARAAVAFSDEARALLLTKRSQQ